MMKKLSKLDVIALVIGSVIGWGAFYLPGTKFLTESGVINTAIGFFIGWGLIFFIQVAYHTMMHHHNETGGEFSYTFTHLGEKHGFIVGWALSFCYLTLIPLNATAVALVLKEVVPGASWGYLYTMAGYPVYISDLLISTLVILFFFGLNRKGIAISMVFQKVIISLLFMIVVAISLYMLCKGNLEQFNTTYLAHYQLDVQAILKVVAIIPFLFVGFDIVPQVLTDLGFPAKSAVKITVLATGAGVLIYNLLNVITALAFTPGEAGSQTWASGSAVLAYLGWAGFLALCVALFAAVVGGINGFMVGSSRVLASLAAYGLLPASFAKENQYHVAEKSLKFVTFISMLLPLLGRVVIIYIVDLSSLMAAVTYAYVCYISAKVAEHTLEKRFSQFGFCISNVFAGLLLIPGSPSQLSTVSLAILVIWILLGLIYFMKVKSK